MRASLVVTLLALVACAPASSGGSYHVLNATQDQIIIEYDRVLTNTTMLMPLVTAYCAKFGTQPYVQTLVRTMGLGTVQADCRPAAAVS